jgi:hypothetical protein
MVVLAIQALSSPPMSQPCIDFKLESTPISGGVGAVEFLLSFKMKPGFECDSVLVHVRPAKRMSYDGPEQFYVHLPASGECSTRLAARVAPNDTSAILIMLSCQNCNQAVAWTGITTDDTVRILDYLPTRQGPDRPVEQKVVDHTAPGSQPSP